MHTNKYTAKYPIRKGETMKVSGDGFVVPARRFVVIDTETNGLPIDYNQPAYKVDNWPRIVQLAVIVWDTGTVAEGAHLIRPTDWSVPEETTKIHGITQEKAAREGADIRDVLRSFLEIIDEPGVTLVAHNMDFDVRVLGAEFLRLGVTAAPNQNDLFVEEGTPHSPVCVLPSICTMKQSTDFCQLPGKYGFKWPNLQELHTVLFGEGFPDAHDALVDARACLKCFLELWSRGIIDA